MKARWLALVLAGCAAHAPRSVRPTESTKASEPAPPTLPLDSTRPAIAARVALGPFVDLASACAKVREACAGTAPCGCRSSPPASAGDGPFLASSTLTRDTGLNASAVHLSVRTKAGWFVAVDAEEAYAIASTDAWSEQAVRLASGATVPGLDGTRWWVATFAVAHAWGVAGSGRNEERRHDRQICVARKDDVVCTAPFAEAPGGYELPP